MLRSLYGGGKKNTRPVGDPRPRDDGVGNITSISYSRIIRESKTDLQDPVVIMPYTDTFAVVEMESHGWVELKTFRSTLRSILYKILANQSSGIFAAAAIVTMVKNAQSAPFDVDIRFPDESIYVDIDHSYVSSRLIAITKALNACRRRCQEEEREGDRCYYHYDVSEFQSLENAAKELISPKVSSDFLQKSDMINFGFYTRESFESNFDFNPYG